MDGIEPESLRLFCPALANELIGCEAFEGLEPAREIVGWDEVCEVSAQLIVIVIVEALDGRVLDGSVHPLDLAIRPGMLDPCQPVLDAMFVSVAEEGNLTLAAKKRLHTAQPSLSRQIRDLEYEVGVRLIERSVHGIELTAAGKVFLNHARLALSQADAAVEAARRATQPARKTFAIGFQTGPR